MKVLSYLSDDPQPPVPETWGLEALSSGRETNGGCESRFDFENGYTVVE
jgi:hypothetical protein